jgi:hypothetical protein
LGLIGNELNFSTAVFFILCFSGNQSPFNNEPLTVKAMQILHAITKTESGYTLKVWEPAEITIDRVRPFLWEINFNAATPDGFGFILEQINLLHQYQNENLKLVPFFSQNLTQLNLSQSFNEAMESDECITHGLCAQ